MSDHITGWLNNLDLSRWWIAAIATGLVIVVTALSAKDRDISLIGFGIIAAGFGEWLNHRKQIEFIAATIHQPGGTITSYPRANRPLGIALDIVGIGLMMVGLGRLLFT